MILRGLTKDVAIFTVDVYKFISAGSGNMVFRKMEVRRLTCCCLVRTSNNIQVTVLFYN